MHINIYQQRYIHRDVQTETNTYIHTDTQIDIPPTPAPYFFGGTLFCDVRAPRRRVCARKIETDIHTNTQRDKQTTQTVRQKPIQTYIHTYKHTYRQTGI